MKEREEKLINKDNERLTWEQIVEKYPHQLVGLVDMELNKPPEPLIKSAVVKCTGLDTTEEEISRLASTEEIFSHTRHWRWGILWRYQLNFGLDVMMRRINR